MLEILRATKFAEKIINAAGQMRENTEAEESCPEGKLVNVFKICAWGFQEHTLRILSFILALKYVM